jgi:hypothetical protein
MIRKVAAHPNWKGWQINRSGKILPQKRGGQLHWPTLVLNGELVSRLKDPFALSPLVVKGFQSCGAITIVNLEKDQVRDYDVETLGGREFVLTLPCQNEPAVFMQDVHRGLASIAAGNRANFLLTLQDVRHMMTNEVSPIILSLGILKRKEYIPFFKEGLSKLSQPSAVQLKINPIDELVQKALIGLWQINNGCKKMVELLSELDFSQYVKSVYNVSLAELIDLRSSILEKTKRQLPQKTGMVKQAFNDLGRINLVESTALQSIDSLRLAALDYHLKAVHLLDVKIMGNETILREVFAEIFRNARRATQLKEARKSDLIKIELQNREDERMLEVRVINKVTHPASQKYLQRQAGFLFSEHFDQDGHGKQRIFRMGISSRKRGGIGLALLWEYVVLKLKGEIHADYDPQENEYSIAVSFRIAQ